MTRRDILMDIYNRLFEAFGPQHWWPGETPFEVMIGAILTQNTAWKNVEKAIARLKGEGIMEPEGLAQVKMGRLAGLIRASGYYNQKARKIVLFMRFLKDEYNLNVKKMKKENMLSLREKLLQVNGIGPETADSILLYALEMPIFVVDSYTYRVFSRHALLAEDTTYEDMQALFMDNLPHDAKLFNEYHALIVRLGHAFCRKTPLCPLGDSPHSGQNCPLEDLLP
mgnify:CR=1 FL=1